MYRFYMNGVQLPVTPSENSTQINNNNSQLQLLNGDEINILKKPKLTDFKFTCQLPLIKQQNSWIYYPNGKFKSAEYYLNMFEDLKKKKKVFDFIIVRDYGNQDLFDTKMRVSLEEYQILEKAEDGDFISVEIRLKQYKEYSTKTLNINIEKWHPNGGVGGGNGGKPYASASAGSRGNNHGANKGIYKPGAIVIVNGQLHRDSWGAGPGQWRRNWKGKISYTNWSGGATFNIHVSTLSGGWQGWVRPSEVKVVG